MKRARTEQPVRPLKYATCRGYGLERCGRCGQFAGNQRRPAAGSIVPSIRARRGRWHCHDFMPLINGAAA